VVKAVWASAGAGSCRRDRPLPLRLWGAGSRINPARSIGSNATLQLISLGCSIPLTQSNSSHRRRAKPERLSCPCTPSKQTATGLSLLVHLGSFQRQERACTRVLDRAQLLSVINIGLSPFLYWWYRLPQNPFYTVVVSILAIAALAFLCQLNFVLQRLTSMLPDETLGHETQVFATLNISILGSVNRPVADDLGSAKSKKRSSPAFLDRGKKPPGRAAMHDCAKC